MEVRTKYRPKFFGRISISRTLKSHLAFALRDTNDRKSSSGANVTDYTTGRKKTSRDTITEIFLHLTYPISPADELQLVFRRRSITSSTPSQADNHHSSSAHHRLLCEQQQQNACPTPTHTFDRFQASLTFDPRTTRPFTWFYYFVCTSPSRDLGFHLLRTDLLVGRSIPTFNPPEPTRTSL